MVKFFKSISKVKVIVKSLNVLYRWKGNKEPTSEIWKSYRFWFKSYD